MNNITKENIIKSYQTDSKGFIVHNVEQLKRIYQAYGINPHSTERRIFDIESLAHFFQDGVQRLFAKLEINSEDKVLSVGEGNGAPSRLLAKLIGCKITGVDINPDQVEKATSCAFLHGVENKVEYYLQDATDLDLPEKHYTKAFLNETVCHWEEKEQAFSRIHNHLVSGAKIGFNLWLRGDRGDLNDAYDKVPSFRGLYKPGIWFQLSLNKLVEKLKHAGFKLIEREDVTDKVDLQIRGKLRGLELAAIDPEHPYSKAMGEHALYIGQRYYEGMLATHYDYLRYGVLIMMKCVQ